MIEREREIGRAGEKEKKKQRVSPLLCLPPPVTFFCFWTSSPTRLTLDERFALARSVGEECIQDDELRLLLEKKPNPVAYDGFEPSGRMHIAQGVMKALNVNKLTRSGVSFKFWVADWFAQLNNKMGGDLAKIKVVGDYMVSFVFSELDSFRPKCVGGKKSSLRFPLLFLKIIGTTTGRGLEGRRDGVYWR